MVAIVKGHTRGAYFRIATRNLTAIPQLPHKAKTYSVSAINIIIFCLSYFKFLKFCEKKTTPFVIIAYFLNLILKFSDSF